MLIFQSLHYSAVSIFGQWSLQLQFVVLFPQYSWVKSTIWLAFHMQNLYRNECFLEWFLFLEWLSMFLICFPFLVKFQFSQSVRQKFRSLMVKLLLWDLSLWWILCVNESKEKEKEKERCCWQLDFEREFWPPSALWTTMITKCIIQWCLPKYYYIKKNAKGFRVFLWISCIYSLISHKYKTHGTS